MPLNDHWPLFGLRLTTPRLQLRLPVGEELAELAEVAAEGIHPADEMPFFFPWTDLPAPELARSVLQYQWRQLGSWTPRDWSLPLAVFVDGLVIGVQEIMASDFAVLRQAGSGSWLGAKYQGQGFGSEMRAAVLELVFEGLGATEVVSGAIEYNQASLTVSRKLGYEEDGVRRIVVRERPATERRLRLSRDRWLTHRTTPVTIDGLEPCLPLFGALPMDH